MALLTVLVLDAAALAGVALRLVPAELAALAAEAGFLEAAVFFGAAGLAADFDTDFFKFGAAFLVLVEAAVFAAVLALAAGGFALTVLALDATEDLEEVEVLDVAARDRPTAPDFFGEAVRFDEAAALAVALVGLALVFADPTLAEVFVFAAI